MFAREVLHKKLKNGLKALFAPLGEETNRSAQASNGRGNPLQVLARILGGITSKTREQKRGDIGFYDHLLHLDLDPSL